MKRPKTFTKMKPRRKYDVFRVGKGNGCYAENFSREYIGSTLAISEKQACNNVRFQTRNDARPNGGYSMDILGDAYDEGTVVFEYEAVLAE